MRFIFDRPRKHRYLGQRTKGHGYTLGTFLSQQIKLKILSQKNSLIGEENEFFI